MDYTIDMQDLHKKCAELEKRTNAKITNLMVLISAEKDFTDLERHTILCELMGCYIFDHKSPLAEFLIEGDIIKFRKRVAHMNKEGEKIKEVLAGTKND